ncbi:MAG: Asp-tRNA(Asn)/Glu-tRNA(Gln) amidotransferase subunit GatB [Deltaproteobacteria bacterium]|jgi:aspartyl-tRNA(Asn)/glutamyl-tRNA(Gln) amidotransferase subunit B
MAFAATLDEALSRYEAVIGLEVHAQLSTRSKLFSDAPNAYDPERPNHFVTAYCFGMPGMLPVLNEGAVDMAVRAGLALGCTVHERSTWARKQYFYPDLPKGYQISQYDRPICTDGHLEIRGADGTPTTIRIERIHMEEDAGKTSHEAGSPVSLVDYNRAGVPLIEIVSKPDLRSAQDAANYLRALRAVLVALGVCDGNMEEGSFRCDANVSIRPIGETELGTRCELKNINSFRYVEQAIEVEILRHARVIDDGGAIVQETRLYDSAKRETRSMRGKEEAHDYRYFPDPDLPPLVVAPERIERLRATIGELPAAKYTRYVETLGIPDEHARAFVDEPAVARYFDAAIDARPEAALGIANLIKGEVLRELKDDPAAIRDSKLSPEELAELVRLRDADDISSTQQKKMFAKLWRDGGSVKALMDSMGGQVDDPAVLGPIVDELFAKHPDEVEKLAGGNKKIISFFVGQVMRATKGKAKPPLVNQLIAERLKER